MHLGKLFELMVGPAHASSFMPPQGTQISVEYDNLYAFLLWASFISCAILIGGMIYFVHKYRRKGPSDKTAYIDHNTFLEFLWSFIPLVIFMVVFAWGWHLYHKMRTEPANPLEVHVFAKQWAWEFAYKSGKRSGNEFVVPVNQDVKLIMTSSDVLHSFYVPSMRIKQDVVPGRYTALYFKAEKLGDYQVFCTEFCGAAHSAMLAKLKVVSREDYEKWLQENEENLTLAERGQKLYNEKGCVACHSVNGNKMTGPTFLGIWGKEHEFADGTKALVDENYVRESILNPQAKVVKGYGPPSAMPTFQGQLDENQINNIIEFLKSLK